MLLEIKAIEAISVEVKDHFSWCRYQYAIAQHSILYLFYKAQLMVVETF